MKHLLTLALCAPGWAWAQGASQAQNAPLNARELFYSMPPNAPASPSSPQAVPSTANKKQKAKSTPEGNTSASGIGNHSIVAGAISGPLGLRYAVQKLDAATRMFREIDPDTMFRTGDVIRMQVETNTGGYLYVVTQGASGKWSVLFPRAEVAGGSNRVEAHQKIEVPGSSGGWRFDEHAGTEKLFLVLARQPEPDLNKLIYTVRGGGNTLVAQATVGDDVVSRLRGQVRSRDLVFEKVDEATQDSAPVKNENAAYVVSVSTAPDAQLVKDIGLVHR